ncbi:MAG TPA: hypothetical protein DD618_01710 [Acholeplasmatales bacterium]|nr:hypothetical protein [Acholeplasmatales bacterium]
MKKKWLLILLGIVGLASAIMALFSPADFQGIVFLLIKFPFSQIGDGLRALSLNGSFGNVIAFILYILLGLMPMGILAFIVFKKKFRIEDLFLPLISGLTFYMMYYMINPQLIPGLFVNPEFGSLGKIVLGSTFYSFLIGYLVIKAVRKGKEGKAEVFTFLKALALIIIFILVFRIFFIGVYEVKSVIESVEDSEMLGLSNGLTIFVTIIKAMINQVPLVLNVAILLTSIELINNLKTDFYSQEVNQTAQKLTKICVVSVLAVVLSYMAVNLLQLSFTKVLLVSNYEVQIPLTSLAFASAMWLLANYFEKSSQLSDDNKLFI